MIAIEELERLDAEIVAALDGDPSDRVDIIGYGEISTVVAAHGRDGPVVCKRLPMMTRAQLAAYASVLADYLGVLEARGLRVAPSEIHAVGADPVTPYCVQPRYDRLMVADLRAGERALIVTRAQQLCELVTAAVRDGIGLDGQVSNWAVDGEELIYLDVTTPLMKDSAGAQRIDLGLFIASLPWVLRGLVRRFLLDEILSHYHEVRPVLLDIVANLYKERAKEAVPVFLDAANAVVDPPLTAEEATAYYRQDARMWQALQWLRRADRWWQRSVRRRRYAFLLPGTIER